MFLKGHEKKNHTLEMTNKAMKIDFILLIVKETENKNKLLFFTCCVGSYENPPLLPYKLNSHQRQRGSGGLGQSLHSHGTRHTG